MEVSKSTVVEQVKTFIKNARAIEVVRTSLETWKVFGAWGKTPLFINEKTLRVEGSTVNISEETFSDLSVAMHKRLSDLEEEARIPALLDIAVFLEKYSEKPKQPTEEETKAELDRQKAEQAKPQNT